MTFSLLNIFTIDSLDPNESIMDFYANPLSTFLPFDNSLQIALRLRRQKQIRICLVTLFIPNIGDLPIPLLDTVLQRFMHQIILILIIMSATDNLLNNQIPRHAF